MGVVHSRLVVLAPVAMALIGLMFAVIGLAFSAAIPLIDYFTYYWTLFLTPMFQAREARAAVATPTGYGGAELGGAPRDEASGPRAARALPRAPARPVTANP